MAGNYGISGGGERQRKQFFINALVIGITSAVLVLIFFPYIQNFFTGKDAQVTKAEPVPVEPEVKVKRNNFTIPVVKPPKVVGTNEPKGGSK